MIDVMKRALKVLENKKLRMDEHLIPIVVDDLRQAIEQAEQWDTSDMAHRAGGLSVEQEKLCKYCGGIGRVVCDGKCMPEQEPVAWAETNDMVCALLRQAHDVLACASSSPPSKRDMSTKPQNVYTSAERVQEIDKSIHEDDDIQEYKKPWVGLTDEELEEYSKWSSGRNVVKAIEQRLKESNT